MQLERSIGIGALVLVAVWPALGLNAVLVDIILHADVPRSGSLRRA